MDREYADGQLDDVKLFIGKEIEKTPAHGLETLFVVGVQDVRMLMPALITRGLKHIYFGANQSFNPQGVDSWNEWDDMIRPFLKDDNIWVTLDFDSSLTDGVLEEAWVEYNNFIAMVSCKVPYIQQLGYNACLKIDDRDFKATNPGVWVHRVHDLKDPAKFTHWSEYTKDLPLE